MVIGNWYTVKEKSRTSHFHYEPVQYKGKGIFVRKNGEEQLWSISRMRECPEHNGEIINNTYPLW